MIQLSTSTKTGFWFVCFPSTYYFLGSASAGTLLTGTLIDT